MSDPELEAIRAERMAQLQGEKGNNAANKKEEEEQRKNEQEQMKNQILSQILDQEARARLNTLSIAKPEKAQMVENMLINMARMGQIMGKIGETELKDLLEKVSEKTQKTTTVKFDRRRVALDDDDEDDYDL